MKILFCWPSASFSTYDVAAGIHEALAADGHELIDYRLYNRIALLERALQAATPDNDDPTIEISCYHASEGLPFAAIKNNCRWVLIVAGMGVHPDAVQALRRIGVKIAVWMTEGPYDSCDAKELYLAQFADLIFTNERTTVPDFQRVLNQHTGGTALYLPHAYRPSLHRPLGPEDPPLRPEERSDVLLIGTGFRERQELLEAIDWTGIDLKLGGLWPGITQESPLANSLVYYCMANQDTVRLYHGAKIVLNPHRWAAGAESANPRTYEVAACGVCQIADYRAEIAEVFGDAVPLYGPGNAEQLSGLIRHYLADDLARRRLIRMARERVQAETFAARARAIVKAIELYSAAQRSRLVAVP